MNKSIGIVIASLVVMATLASALVIRDEEPLPDANATAIPMTNTTYTGWAFLTEPEFVYEGYGAELTYNAKTRGHVGYGDTTFYWNRCLPLNYEFDPEACPIGDCEIGTCTANTGETITLYRSLTMLEMYVSDHKYQFAVYSPPQDPPCKGLKRSC
jgi:hypothetical protein